LTIRTFKQQPQSKTIANYNSFSSHFASNFCSNSKRWVSGEIASRSSSFLNTNRNRQFSSSKNINETPKKADTATGTSSTNAGATDGEKAARDEVDLFLRQATLEDSKRKLTLVDVIKDDKGTDPASDPVSEQVMEEKDRLDLFYVFSREFFEQPFVVPKASSSTSSSSTSTSSSSESIVRVGRFERLLYLLFGVGAIGVVGWALYVFSEQYWSPLGAQRLFNGSLQLLLSNTEVVTLLGEPIYAYGGAEIIPNPIFVRNPHVLKEYAAWKGENGVYYKAIEYHVAGSQGVGIVTAISRKDGPLAMTLESVKLDYKKIGERTMKTIVLA
jgi:hypothetical protein